MTIGATIKAFREKNKLTRKELAEEIGVTDVTISRYENGKRDPSSETLYKIAKVLNVSLDEIMRIGTQSSPKDDNYIQTVDNIEFDRQFKLNLSIDTFFEGLGITLFKHYDKEKKCDYFTINGIRYDVNQFDSLIASIKFNILNTTEILRNSNNMGNYTNGELYKWQEQHIRKD